MNSVETPPAVSNDTTKANTKSSSTKAKAQGRGRSNSLPKETVEYLKAWLWDHRDHPYPTDQEKAGMVADTGLSISRLNNWFVNNRIRYWKPRMEALQRQQSQEPKGAYTQLLASPSSSNNKKKTSSASEEHPKTDPNTSFVDRVSPPAGLDTTLLLSFASRATPVSPTLSSVDSVADDLSSDGSLDKPLPSSCSLPKAPILVASKKRSRTESLESPRTKFSRKNENLWRMSCLSSPRCNDAALPTLDEAALLFGYAQSQ